jgi:hypothetical protein
MEGQEWCLFIPIKEIEMKNVAQIVYNKVVNIICCEDNQDLQALSSDDNQYVLYDPSIHPWNKDGFCDIEIGVDWTERYKIKFGYCVTCSEEECLC